MHSGANMPLMHPGVNPSMQLPQVQQVPTPQCTRNKAPIAEQLTSKLLAVSAGRPVKVWLPPDVAPLKRLDAIMPAESRFCTRSSKSKAWTLCTCTPGTGVDGGA